jgi:hypothetical protein
MCCIDKDALHTSTRFLQSLIRQTRNSRNHMLQFTDGSAGLDLTRPNHHNAPTSVPDLFIPDRGKEHTVTRHYITLRQKGNTKFLYKTQTRNHNIPLQLLTTSHMSQPTHWGRGKHMIYFYSSVNLLNLQKRSKPCFLFSLPFPIIRHYLRCIHDVRLRLPRVMLDFITLPGNLIVGLGVLNAPKSMLKNRFHLILERAFHFNWRRWGLYPTVFPVRLTKRHMKHRMDTPTRIQL